MGIFDPDSATFLPCSEEKERKKYRKHPNFYEMVSSPTYVIHFNRVRVFTWTFSSSFQHEKNAIDRLESIAEEKPNQFTQNTKLHSYSLEIFLYPEFPFQFEKKEGKKTHTHTHTHADKGDKWLRSLFFESTNMEKCTQSESTYKMGANGTIVKWWFTYEENVGGARTRFDYQIILRFVINSGLTCVI